ncbi:MAG: hypothetical protein EOO39_26950 [Cytophagaceae bacterium]|nr:MAG: hypothetical protein EOO39_26950 [Cytophagaceae bacterium]
MSHIAVVNYHLAKSTHETALHEAGLTQINWHLVVASPADSHGQEEAYWTAILNSQPIIGLSASVY